MEKQKIVGIKFEELGQVYYFNPKELNLKKNDRVIVETSRGQDVGIVAIENTFIESEKLVEPLKDVIRMVNEKDLKHLEHLEEKNLFAEKKAKALASQYNLDMSITNAKYEYDESKVVISFTAEDRVDFRELVKDLARQLHTRIELKQIGIRDEAKIVGGIGPCGRELCCRKFLSDIGKVSIKMAKNQGISLNPTSINGVCGRLMCCLGYENDTYVELLQQMPKLGAKVKTKDGIGNVCYNDLLKQIVSVKFKKPDESFEINDYPLNDIEVLEKGNDDE